MLCALGKPACHSAASCVQEMERAKQLSCPLCCKSFDNMQDVWDVMDEEARNNPMPPEYAGWRVIILPRLLFLLPAQPSLCDTWFPDNNLES